MNRTNACISCSSKFGLLDRKRSCSKCSALFCSTCLPKERGVVKRTCGRCKIVCTNPLYRSAVMDLRVCDLKWFLNSKSISMLACTEKSELVDLVMLHAPNAVPLQPSTASNSQHRDSYTEFRNSPMQEPNHSSSFYSNSRPRSPQVTEERVGDVYSHSWPASPKLPGNSSNQVPTFLGDLENPDQIAQLSIGHMKLILVRNYVDFKGCCEKQELQERVLRLWNEKKKNSERDPETLEQENLCKICWEAEIDCVMLECGHMATCTACGKQMNECPICRQYVVRVVHTFRA